MVRFEAHARLAPDEAPHAYGTTLITVHNAAGELERTEVRGRELEVIEIRPLVELDDGRHIASERCEQWHVVRLSSSRAAVRRDIEQSLFGHGGPAHGRNRWPGLMRALAAAGVTADDELLEALPRTVIVDPGVTGRFRA
jgi:hypothetical protein